MKKRTSLVLGIGCLVLAGSAIISCNKSNSSTPLPSMMDFMLNKNWRLDTVILIPNGGSSDTLTMADVPGFSTSNIKFYNRVDSGFIFRDVLNAGATGPDGRDSLFRYAYGKWALSPAQDSIYLYSQDTIKARGYAAAWAISKVDSSSILYADYMDTVPKAGQVPQVLRKRAVFVKSTFY